MDKKIFVVYIGIGSSNDETEIGTIIKEAYKNIVPIFNDQNAEVIFIPTRTIDSKIECINPQYITDEDLIRKNRLLIDQLHESLDSYLNDFIKETKENG